MKIGIAISCALMLVFAAFIIVGSLEYPDKPSRETADPKVLKKVSFPSNLPQVAVLGEAGDADALYKQAIDLYKSRPSDFRPNSAPPLDKAQPMTDLLIQAMQAGAPRRPFLDKYVGQTLGKGHQLGDFLFDVGTSMQQEADRLRDAGEAERAILLVRAIFTLGLNCVNHCDRMWTRYYGLKLMEGVGIHLYNWGGKDEQLAAQFDPWVDPINMVKKNWDHKWKIITNQKPKVLGDVFNIIDNDEDMSWRAEALLQLCRFKHNPGHGGNLRKIENLAEQYSNSNEKQLSAAAKAVKRFTEDDLDKIIF